MPSDASPELSGRAEPTVTPFSSEDLGRVFNPDVLRRGRSLILLETVNVSLKDASIAVVVDHLGLRNTASITPTPRGSRLGFLNRCSCGQSACAHVAAGALAALDQFPALRRAEQTSFLTALSAPANGGSALLTAAGPRVSAAGERQRLVFELCPGGTAPCLLHRYALDRRANGMGVSDARRLRQ